MKQERFYSPEIIRDEGAKIKHFTPLENGRDKFGNRIFSSPKLAYKDRSEEITKAALLVSQEGEDFLAKNKGILQDISWGLSQTQASGRTIPEYFVDLGNGRTLEMKGHGEQSIFSVLIVNGKKYAIKTHFLRKNKDDRFDQPYINEMLQVQSIAQDLKSELGSLGIKMPTFLFASGQVSCTSFEEGSKVFDSSHLARLEKLHDLVSRYIAQKRASDPLWKNVHEDILFSQEERINNLIDNFILKPDGTMVWIDPLVYYKV